MTRAAASMACRRAVHSLAIHPTGRLALSVAADKTLRLWDLTKAKPAFSGPLPGEGLVVRWAPDGTSYAIMFEGAVILYDGTTAAERSAWKSPPGVRLLDMAFLPVDDASGVTAADGPSSSDDVIALGCEGGDVRLWCPAQSWMVPLTTGHAKRVRCLTLVGSVGESTAGAAAASSSSAASVELSAAAGTVEGSTLRKAAAAHTVLTSSGPFLATVDSDCIVKLWDVPGLLRSCATAVLSSSGSRKSGISSSSSGSGSCSSESSEVRVEGFIASATLSAGSGARATALVGSHEKKSSSGGVAHAPIELEAAIAVAPPLKTTTAAAAAPSEKPAKHAARPHASKGLAAGGTAKSQKRALDEDDARAVVQQQSGATGAAAAAVEKAPKNRGAAAARKDPEAGDDAPDARRERQGNKNSKKPKRNEGARVRFATG